MRFRAKLIWLLVLAMPVSAFEQKALRSDPVRLEPIRQISEGLDAWPRILNPKNGSERHINSILDSYNVETRKILAQCTANEEWSREIRVTMAGPHYLSLQAGGANSCSAVHPNPYDAALLCDLGTGELLDGSTVIEKNSEIKVVKATEIARYPQSEKFLLSSRALDGMLMASANDNCKESLQEVTQNSNLDGPILYSVWPDVEKNQVIVKPVSLSYLDYLMCSEEVDIPPNQARKLGFSKLFLQAIDQAYRATLRQ